MDTLAFKNYENFIYGNKNFLTYEEFAKAMTVITPEDCIDTPANEVINQAIDSLPKNPGGLVYIKEGTYVLSEPIIINRSNVTLMGSGAGTKLFLADGANNDMIKIGNGSTTLNLITVRDLFLDGNKANNPYGLYGIYLFGSATNKISYTCIHNVLLYRMKQKGIVAEYMEKSTISLCKSISHDSDNIVLSYSIENIIDRNHLYSSGAQGIDFYFNCNNNIISKNIIKSHGYNGILLYSNSNNNIISNNQILNNGNDGIRLNEVDNNIIHSNKCFGNSGYGINVSNETSNNNYIFKNFLAENTTGSFYDAGTGTIVAASTTNDNVL